MAGKFAKVELVKLILFSYGEFDVTKGEFADVLVIELEVSV